MIPDPALRLPLPNRLRSLAAALAVAATIGLAAAPPATAQPAVEPAPRAETRLGEREAVLVAAEAGLTLYLQRYVDGEPISGAAVSITLDGTLHDAAEIETGIYRVAGLRPDPGRHELSLAVETASGRSEGRLALTVPPPPDPPGAALMSYLVPGVLIVAAAGGGIAIGFAVARRKPGDRAG